VALIAPQPSITPELNAKDAMERTVHLQPRIAPGRLPRRALGTASFREAYKKAMRIASSRCRFPRNGLHSLELGVELRRGAPVVF
jgi:hypothetical protein